MEVYFYDDKGRKIQTRRSRYLVSYEAITTQYSFSGQPLVVVSYQEKQGANPQSHTIITKLEYDNLGRLLTTKKTVSTTINSQSISKPEQVIASHEYDALGRLRTKKLSPTGGPGGTLLARQDYEYNIRDWLISINKNYLTNANNAQYFALELGYDKNGSLGTFTPQYNGNISGTLWKSEGDQQRRKYDFTYDVTNRLTGADFNQYVSGSGASAIFNKSAGMDFSISGLTYDANGNILTQKQRGWKLSGSVTIDSLSYNYIANSNRLLNVIDGVNDAQTRLGDFRTSSLHPNAGNKNSNTIDYAYNGNGNLKKDLNKDIDDASLDAIEYNHLNLPVRIRIKNAGSIEYVYNNAGVKFKKIVHETGKPDRTTLYLDGFVYENDTLQYIAHEEGRIRFAKIDSSVCTPQPNRFFYDYFIKDHLGSVRMVLTEQKENICYPAASVEDSRYQKEDDY